MVIRTAVGLYVSIVISVIIVVILLTLLAASTDPLSREPRGGLMLKVLGRRGLV